MSVEKLLIHISLGKYKLSHVTNIAKTHHKTNLPRHKKLIYLSISQMKSLWQWREFNSMRQFLNQFQPFTIFFIDAVGAFFSLLIIFFILIPLESYLGMPSPILFKLAIIAGTLFIYSSTCAIRRPKQWKTFLLGVIFGNLTYCGVSIYFLVENWESLLTLGVLYFISEKLVILGLVGWEIKIYVSK